MATPEDVADKLNSASIHLLRWLRRSDTSGGTSPAALSALSVVVYAGPISLGQLAEAEQVRSPTMTRLVDQMVGDGLVTRKQAEDDGRSTMIVATESGKLEIIEGRRRRVETLAAQLRDLPAEDSDLLARAADLIAEIVERPHHG